MKKMKQMKLDGNVFGVVIDAHKGLLTLDIRNEQARKNYLRRIDIDNFQYEDKDSRMPWLSHIDSSNAGLLYFVEYTNKSDPNKQCYHSFDWDKGVWSLIDFIPDSPVALIRPMIYEQGTEYHKTVEKFITLPMPLSCEYLEWHDKIIISYYLRCDNAYERHLLLLKDGIKVWSMKQDRHIKGFSSDAFFIFQNQLIAIKDRNEICLYPE